MAGFYNSNRLVEMEKKEKNDAILREKIKRKTFQQDQDLWK